jgi:hypothetical protein
MPESCSPAIEPPRPRDTVAHSDTKSEFVARETSWLEEGITLQSSWSFVERLYALPF